MQIHVPTPLGLSRLTVDAADAPKAVLWLGHGAGGGIDTPDLWALAEALPAAGITVVRHEQPWRLAGRRIAPRPAALDTAWLEASARVHKLANGLPLVIGGRSAGARVACRTAAETGAAAVVAISFPLHPPGNPERSRLDELMAVQVPLLVVQGERDVFGNAELLRTQTAGADIRVVAVPDADHSLKPLKASAWEAEHVERLLVESVRGFVEMAARAR